MNQASWSHILRRADDEDPEESGAAIIRLQDHAPHWPKNRPGTLPPSAESSGLENDLQKALSRASRRAEERAPLEVSHRSAAPARPHRAEIEKRQPGLRRGPNPGPRAVAQSQKSVPHTKKSGAKNLLAVSLTIAIIGFALHELNTQWLEANAVRSAATHTPEDDTSVTKPPLFAESAATNAPSEKGSEGAAINENRLDLRPSLAGGSDAAAKEQSALSDDIETAARLFQADEVAQERSASLPAAASSFDSTEQMMLRRGQKMIERGHISGARLIFEHLAEQKSALGAFALAQTYDPRFLAAQGSEVTAQDEALAAKWYQKAEELTTSR